MSEGPNQPLQDAEVPLEQTSDLAADEFELVRDALASFENQLRGRLDRVGKTR